MLTRRMKCYESYGYETLLSCLKQYAETISRALERKQLPDDTRKINYLFAIIDSHINETKRAETREKMTRASYLPEPEAIRDLETQHQEKDIRRWLDDDDG